MFDRKNPEGICFKLLDYCCVKELWLAIEHSFQEHYNNSLNPNINNIYKFIYKTNIFIL